MSEITDGQTDSQTDCLTNKAPANSKSLESAGAFAFLRVAYWDLSSSFLDLRPGFLRRLPSLL